jgi:hypothetical protein
MRKVVRKKQERKEVNERNDKILLDQKKTVSKGKEQREKRNLINC